MSKPLRVIYAGTPDFAVPALRALLASEHDVCAVYTQPDRPSGRGRKLTASPVKQVALEHDVAVYQPATLRDQTAQETLAALNADVMIVAAYGLLLPEAVLNAPRYGCLNIHASLLPRWRGAAPIHRAILAGDDESGVTIMQMAKGLDTGNMLHKFHCPITPEMTSSMLHDILAEGGAAALMATLDQLIDGTLQPEVQDEQYVTYAQKLDKAEAVIDWRESADTLCRKVCALHGWPVAETQYQGKRLRIWGTAVSHVASVDNAQAGEILEASREGIDVQTGEGVLRLTQLQLPGKKALHASDFINGRSLVGEVLGGDE